MEKKLNNDEKFIIFSGNANLPLAEEVCEHLGVKLGKTKIDKFSDGETQIENLDRVRKKEGVFI